MTLQAGTLLLFGLENTVQTYGLLQSASFDASVRRAKAKSPSGATVSIQEFDEEEALSLTYIPISATGAPSIGTAFTYDGTVWRIDSVVSEQIVDGFVNITVLATHYPEIQVVI